MIKRLLFTIGMLLATSQVMAAPEPEFVYAATSAGLLYQYRIAPGGRLRPLMPPTVKVSAERSIRLALHPSGKFLYVVTLHLFNQQNDHGTILCYHVQPNGTLEEVAAASRTVATAVDNLIIDPRGRFLFASGEHDRLFTFQIQPNGTLRPLAENKVETFGLGFGGDGLELNSYSEDFLAFDSAGRFLYAFDKTGFADHTEYSFVPYRLDEKGVLHPLAAAAQGSEQKITSLFTTANGQLFVNIDGYNSGAHQFHIRPNGLLSPASPPILTDQDALLVTQQRHRQTLWTASVPYPGQIIAAYRLYRNGRLVLQTAHADLWENLQQVAADPSGRFLYAVQDGHFGIELLAYAVTPLDGLKALDAVPQQLAGRCTGLVVNLEKRKPLAAYLGKRSGKETKH